MPRRSLTLLCVVCLSTLALTVSAPNVHAQSGLVTLDYPNATETDCNDININGTIVGFYVDSTGIDHGFTQIKGNLMTVDVPGAQETLLYGVNDFDHAVGWYTDSSGLTHGLLIGPGQKVKTFDPPGAVTTNAWDVNNSYTIVGAYVDSGSVTHGFFYAGGKFTTYDAPGGSILTEITGINDQNDIVGIYDDSSGVEHGFAVTNGLFIKIDYPGSGVAVTSADRINKSGEVVGLWGTSTSGPFSGYTTKPHQPFNNVMFPGSTETRVRGLNIKGVITGRYTDTNGVVHGFYGTP